MANCKIIKRKQNKTFMTEKVFLELSPEEAYSLIMILDNIGGCPDTSPRKFIRTIYDALGSAKIESPIGLYDITKYCSQGKSEIYFKGDTLQDFMEKALEQDNKPD